MDPSSLSKTFDGPTVIILIMFITAVAAMATGKLAVPRYVYDREKDRADKGEVQIEKLTDLLEDYNSQLRALRRGQTDV